MGEGSLLSHNNAKVSWGLEPKIAGMQVKAFFSTELDLVA